MAEPPITIRAAHDSGPGNGPVTRVVIHATCPNVGYSAASAPGAQHGTALYFATAAAGGSAHYVCGVDGEEHCVPEDVIAWHAPPNAHSLGIEITAEGGQYPKNYSRDQWLSDAVWPAVQRAAARCRDLCDRHGIPLVKLTPADLLAGKKGICGHVDVSQAWHQSDHSDPNNSTFPWDRFMAEVQNPQEDDMTPDQAAQLKALYDERAKIDNMAWSVLGDDKQPSIRAVLTSILGQLAKQADPAALAAALAPLIIAALPSSGLSEADMETAIRNVLGSLAGNPPAA